MRNKPFQSFKNVYLLNHPKVFRHWPDHSTDLNTFPSTCSSPTEQWQWNSLANPHYLNWHWNFSPRFQALRVVQMRSHCELLLRIGMLFWRFCLLILLLCLAHLFIRLHCRLGPILFTLLFQNLLFLFSFAFFASSYFLA